MTFKSLGVISYNLDQQKIGNFKSHFNIVSRDTLYFLASKTKANHPLISEAPNQLRAVLKIKATPPESA